MNPAPVIYCVTVEDTSDNPEGAAELFNALELDFSSWRDEETRHVRHTVYCADEASAAAFWASRSCLFAALAAAATIRAAAASHRPAADSIPEARPAPML